MEIIDTKEWEDKKLIIFISKDAKSKWIHVGLLEKKRITNLDGMVLNGHPLIAHNNRFIAPEGNDLPFTYGALNDNDIESIEVKKENEYTKAEIYETNYGRFFLSQNKFSPVRALDEKGNVIHEEHFRG